MNRRTFATAAAITSILPFTAVAKQGATPQPHVDSVDVRTRELTTLLASIAPSELLAALESTEVTNELLTAENGGSAPTVVPWADYGDTDLYSSLGGVGLTSGGTNLSDPDTAIIGAYIVYESAEIAYHEFTRKIGDLYDNPSQTTTVAGTNVWLIESSDLQIGTWRIGNVMMMAVFTNFEGGIMEGIVGHLADVAGELSDSR